MIDIKNGYDSHNPSDLCDLCHLPISSNKTIIGTGNSILLLYHPNCWLLATQSFVPPSSSLPISISQSPYLP